MNTATGQKTPLPRAASTVHFNLFDEGDVLAARPTPLVEVQPQPGVQRHTAEQIIETFVPVQILDAPVPQMGGEQVVEFMQQFDVLAGAEPVIEVPKISLDKARRRMVDFARPPQTAEQLVDVPTIISYSSLQRTVEQNIAIPVPQVRGGGGGGLQGFRPGQGSPAADVEQIVDIPGGADEGIQGGFRTFSRPEKSAGLGPHSRSELSADFTSSTPAAYVVFDGPPTWVDGAGLTWWQSASGRWYLDRDPSIW